MNNSLNDAVTAFLDSLHHPLRAEIEQLRLIILGSHHGLTENIKWNAPNYCCDNQDRLTMKIQPPRQIQLIFHRGAKKTAQPNKNVIEDNSGLLVWKEHDRAIATFTNKEDIAYAQSNLMEIVNKWMQATKQ